MLQEYSTIIVDTSCFILLDKIGQLDILFNLFGEVTTTNEIAAEFGKPLPGWVNIQSVANKKQQQIIELEIDKGEASAITLYFEKKSPLLILDDAKARKFAEKLHLNYTGTLGIILKAKETGIITAIKPIIQKIQTTNFRFSDKVFNEILKLAGE